MSSDINTAQRSGGASNYNDLLRSNFWTKTWLKMYNAEIAS